VIQPAHAFLIIRFFSVIFFLFCFRLETAQKEAPNLKSEEAKIQKEIDKTNTKRVAALTQFKDGIKVRSSLPLIVL